MATNVINKDFERSEASDKVEDKGLLRNEVDDNVLVNVIPVKQDIISSLKDVNKITPDQGLIDFLARPQILKTGTFSSTNTVGQNLADGDCFAPFTYNPIYAEKLNGFGGVRATTKITVQVNAQKFQQGLYFLCYIPAFLDDVMGTNAARLLSIVTQSQLPHVELDVSCDTQATLEIPYVHCNLYYNWNTGDPGRFFLICYSPLLSGTGSLSASFTVWTSFHDVELFAPTLRRAILQMGPEENDSPPSASKSMRTVSKVFKTLAGVPVLSSVAEPVGWATGVVADGMAALGWSKPTDTRPVGNVQQQTATNVINVDGPTATMPLGLFASNEVAKMDSFGRTGVDEMSLAFVSQQKAYLRQFIWTDTMAYDDVINSFLVYPNYSTVVGARDYLPPVTGVARAFHLWRGTIRFRFKVVKTEMHSGRLLVTFAPGYTSTSGITAGTSSYLMRNIFDLRDGSEFVINVPFVSARSWLPTDIPTGILTVAVLNPLRAPPTCAQNVAIVVEISGGEDFRVAVPRSTVPLPYRAAIAGLRAIEGASSTADDQGLFETEDREQIPILQMGEENPCLLYDGGIGGSQATPSISPSLYTIGEEVTSIKQIVSSVSWMDRKNAIQAFMLNPSSFGGAADTSIRSAVNDPMSYWASMFLFNRGSVDVHVFPSEECDMSFSYTYGGANGTSPYTEWTTTSLGPASGSRTTFERTTRKRVLQVRTPQYTYCHSRFTGLYSPNQVPGVPGEFESKNGFYFTSLGTTTAVDIGRSGGDDFQFGFFLGIYPVCSG